MPRFCVLFAAFSVLLGIASVGSAQVCDDGPSDCGGHLSDCCDGGSACDDVGCDECESRRKLGNLLSFDRSILCDTRRRTPAMLGGFYGGNSVSFRGESTLDRLIIVADDLDAPAFLPGGGSTLTITEPGPVGIFNSSVGSIQELQALLRAGSPIPAFNLEGSVVDNATLTTLSTIADIQAQLAGTGVGYDIILLAPPPGTYDSAVDGVFQTRNGIPGTTVLNTGSSGALIQGGVDTLNGGEDLDAFYFYDYIIRLNTSLADVSSGGVGRMKIADNGVVLPQDRVFFRYGNIYNTTFAPGSPNLNRFVAGFERAFMDNLLSLELRAPFATDAANAYTLAGNAFTNGTATRFGNLNLYLKSLLVDNGRFAVSGGLGISLPTASDTSINYANGTELLHISSEAVHLQPFLGMLFTPNRRCFAQAFMQYDIATNGNAVAINTGTGLTPAGSLTDANHLLFDGAIGYWLYQNNQARGLTGVIPTFEVHQTVATGDGDVVSAGPFQVGNFNGNRSITSLVAGTTFEFGTRTQITAGYATAVGSDRDYDGAFQIQLNHLLGQ
jgi:hypothetical protein